MPACAIQYHHEVLVWVASANLIQKHLHARAVDLRQNQRIQSAIYRADGPIHVGVLLSDHRLDQWPVRPLVPAVANIDDPPKAHFVLKHQPYGAWHRERGYFLRQALGKFFSMLPAPPGRLEGGFCRALPSASRDGPASDIAWTVPFSCPAWPQPPVSAAERSPRRPLPPDPAPRPKSALPAPGWPWPGCAIRVCCAPVFVPLPAHGRIGCAARTWRRLSAQSQQRSVPARGFFNKALAASSCSCPLVFRAMSSPVEILGYII